jgi:hypothetical protein
MHNHVTLSEQKREDMWREILEELLRGKQSYLLAAFFNHASDPMQHACLRLFPAGRSYGVKLIVKRKAYWSGGYPQTRVALH